MNACAEMKWKCRRTCHKLRGNRSIWWCINQRWSGITPWGLLMKVPKVAENQFFLVLEICQKLRRNVRLIMPAEVTSTMYANNIKFESVISQKRPIPCVMHSRWCCQARREEKSFAIHKIPIFISLFPDVSQHKANFGEIQFDDSEKSKHAWRLACNQNNPWAATTLNPFHVY